MIRRCIKPGLACVLLATASLAGAGSPLLTGIVEDVNAQTIEMPSLPGSWQRRIEWMIQEGAQVAIGDVVVRLDPGDLISQEAQTRTELEKQQLSAERQVNEAKLAVMDAERIVAEAGSAVRLAELDASIPAGTIPKLDYDRYQLALETARQSLIRAQADLLNTGDKLADVVAETELVVEQATNRHLRIQNALDATMIRAEKAGFMVYGDNPFNGKKIFPGETIHTGIEIASIASREDLQIRFWVHEADILEIETGQELVIVADAQGSEAFVARVDWVSSQAVTRDDWSDSGYFSALAQPVDGVPDTLWPGMSVLGQSASEDKAL